MYAAPDKERRYYMKLLLLAPFIAALLMSPGCKENQTNVNEPVTAVQENKEDTVMKIKIGNKEFTAELEDNSSVDALKMLMKDGLTLDMSDYAGMEKGADLGSVLPQNNVPMNTEPGDIILYQGRTLVIYYDTNSWSLTPIGKINNVNADELKKALGKGNVTVTFSL